MDVQETKIDLNNELQAQSLELDGVQTILGYSYMNITLHYITRPNV